MQPDHFDYCLHCGKHMIRYDMWLYQDTCSDCLIAELEYPYLEALIQIKEMYNKWRKK
jgi:hypothetical protein